MDSWDNILVPQMLRKLGGFVACFRQLMELAFAGSIFVSYFCWSSWFKNCEWQRHILYHKKAVIVKSLCLCLQLWLKIIFWFGLSYLFLCL